MNKKMKNEIIGHGTWLDKIAYELLNRERRIDRRSDIIKTESGLGASGLPHVGSFSDCARSYGIKLALEEFGAKSEYIAFSDDKDGLRKVPEGMPKSLKKFLGFPVTSIPDPFKCHTSFGNHVSSLLIDAMDKSGIEYTFYSATEAYRKGLFNNQIESILLNSEKIGKIIHDELGQEKYVEMLPYFPVCENCGRIYTTTTQKFFLDEKKISYVCDGMKLHDQRIEGCKHKGEVNITKGEGKLSWKVEFAARWDALEINFEAYGKDIADSVRVNDRICKEILNYEPPMHVKYEMFLDRGGKKISKSKGNVFTPQAWLKYGSPQSLLLLMFKRITGTRTISPSEIPKYMDEIDELEQVFFDKKKIKDKKELEKLKGLFLYSWLLKPPANPSVNVPYNLLVYLSRVAPRDRIEDFIIDKLRIYDYIKDSPSKGIINKINYAINWSTDFQQIEKVEISLSPNEKNAINELIETMQMEDDEERIQHSIFELAKRHGILPKNFFRVLYTILLGVPQGPRLGSYIETMGKELVLNSLKEVLKSYKEKQ